MDGRRRFTLGCILLTLLTVAVAGCTQPAPGGPGGDAGKPALKVGVLLDKTGSLAQYGTPMADAATLAAQKINAVPGASYRLELRHEDDESKPAAGVQAAKKLQSEQVSAIVGATGSSVTKAVMEVTQPGRILEISSSSSDPSITALVAARAPADRYFLRTAPADDLQGRLAAEMAKGLGWNCTLVLHIKNDYGEGLRSYFTDNFGSSGQSCVPGQRTVRAVSFPAEAASYDTELATAFAGCTAAGGPLCPDGVFFVAYPREAQVLMRNWWSKPEWRTIPWLHAEGTRDEALFKTLASQQVNVTGHLGTSPQSLSAGFDVFKGFLGGAEPKTYQAHTYDAVMLIALAAEKARSTDSTALRNAVRDVANAPGEKVGPGDFAKAVDLLKQGKDIDYEGASGSLTFDANGDTSSPYEIWVVAKDGTLGRKCIVMEEDVLKAPPPVPEACLKA